ncbi:MAG: discoidin domain-containing protein [Acholeplasmataceae bacterium]|nr:bacterial Ig-like domain-containing protein [Acholeplasmataceae bacterium]
MKHFRKIAILTLIILGGIFLLGCKKTTTAELIISGTYKTTYFLNQEFDPEGLVVTFKKGSTEEIVTDYQISGFNSSVVGSNTVTITYQDVSAQFSVDILFGVQSSTELKIYDMPDILKSSERYEIKVEDSPLFVYETLVNHARSFTWINSTSYTSVASFDFLGKVHVSITVLDDYEVSKATVHPLSYDIETTITDNVIEFDLEYPANYTIQLNDPVAQITPNGSVIQEAIHLFANPIEEDPITEEEAEQDDSILYIGPGVWKTDTIPLESDKTVYLAGGALVYGQFNAYELHDITIRGRGIISGSIYPREEAAQRAIPIELQKSENIYIEGISFLDPAGWTIHAQESKNIIIDNIKVITARPNGDGISIQSCEDVIVRNSFVRTWDDSLVVKNVNNVSTKNVTFSNNILWTDLAQSMEVGYETYGESIENVVFEDITVLHNYHKAVMSIHNADQADINGIYFKDITIEDAYEVGDIWTETYDNFFIDLTIAFNADWSKSQYERGIIRNVYFDNIKVLNDKKIGADSSDLIIRMNGFDATKNISNIYFNDVEFHGEPLTSVSQINANNFVSNIEITSSETPTGAHVYHYYELDLGDYYVVEKDVIAARVQEAIEIPDFSISHVEPPYAGAKITGDFEVRATYGVTTQDWGGASVDDYDQEGYEVTNVLLDDQTMWKSNPWPEDVTKGSYVALSVIFNEVHKVGSIRLFGDAESMYFQMQNISIYAATAISENTGLPIFSKKLNGENYEFSPSKNNYVDIRLAPGDYIAVQLRFYGYEGVTYAEEPFLRYIEFYPASLTYGKTPYASPFEDVYNPEKLTDGDVTTYFESKKNLWPGWIVVDMGDVYNVRIINLHLPPLSSWPNRTQTIEIKYSIQGETSLTSANWINLFSDPIDYLFDGASGNMVSITLPESVSMRSIILIVTDNTAPGGYGAQFSEISIYE